MTNPITGRMATFTNPLPGVVLGDPFILRHRGLFYMYGTNDGPPLPDGRAVPVLRSDDMIAWESLGGALIPHDPTADHWAPEVLAWNGRLYMVVSYGDVVHRGHALWVAVADRPEGPFELRSRISGPEERFSIDGAWLLDDDGRLYLFRCIDFVAEDDPPHGTGIVVQPMHDPLTPAGPPRPVLRASAPWHLFETDRGMPLYDDRRFAEWTTIEGPAPLRRGNRYYCGYSGGNYTGAYGTGEAVADSPLGPYHDLRGREGPIFGTTPGLVEGPGHFSVVSPDLLEDWIVLHGRLPGEAVRRVWLCPASWGEEGVAIGELTDRPQPAPRLPADRSYFAGGGSLPAGWRIGQGTWTPGPDGLHHAAEAGGIVWRDGLELAGDWAVELFLRLPGTGPCRGGVILGGRGGDDLVFLEPRAGRLIYQRGGNELASAPLPGPGDVALDWKVSHTLMVRAISGRSEVRVDQVALISGLDAGAGPWRLGLFAEGHDVFDVISISLRQP